MAVPPISEEMVHDALRRVVTQDGERDLMQAGLITGLALRGPHVSFVVEIPPQYGKDPQQAKRFEPLRRAAEKAVADIPGVLSVSVALTAKRAGGQKTAAPPDSGGKAAASNPAGVRAIIAVASGKGGVGKSTVAVNLACVMARQGLRIGLLDADIYGPSCPHMLGISGRPDSPDGKVIIPHARHGVVCMSIGFLIDDNQPMIWRGPMVMSAIQQLLRNVAWGELDILLIDMPPGTGDAQLTIAQQTVLAGVVIVSTPQDIALLDARKGIEMFRRVDTPILGLVENMSYFRCPKCGERTEIFAHGGAKQAAERMGIPFLGEIPLELVVRAQGDAGVPVTVAEPDHDISQSFATIATTISQKVVQFAPNTPKIEFS